MPDKLDKEILLYLLAEADTDWFVSHPGPMDYREHLKFTAEYIVKNYNTKAKMVSKKGYSANSEERVNGHTK